MHAQQILEPVQHTLLSQRKRRQIDAVGDRCVVALSGFTKAWLLYLGLFFVALVRFAPALSGPLACPV